ncbi:MAG: hypothetical protein JSR60_08600 [Proteobacteria bacterium]|nr:hypothetical protein [Pseudomonadota bacterium]
MNWIERWNSLSARIEGLLGAVNFIVQTMGIQHTFAPETKHALLSEVDALLIEMRKLHEDEGNNMPKPAAQALAEFVANPIGLRNNGGQEAVALQGLSPIFVFRSRYSYLIRDSEIEGRNATELAFEHLNRVIAVNEEVRNAWKTGFEKGELACERLGSVHLLSHGIWAFKVQAKGAATDLVYNEPLSQGATVLRRSSRAIVLTEWKVVRSGDRIYRAAEEARLQTKDYAAGILGDLELKRTRYIALVGERKLQTPDDFESNGVTYRHIWIAVDPETPSVSARSRSRRRDMD